MNEIRWRRQIVKLLELCSGGLFVRHPEEWKDGSGRRCQNGDIAVANQVDLFQSRVRKAYPLFGRRELSVGMGERDK